MILRSPKLIDVPFFAFPFRFPKLEAIPEKFTDAVKSFDTESILTGLYVSKLETFFVESLLSKNFFIVDLVISSTKS